MPLFFCSTFPPSSWDQTNTISLLTSFKSQQLYLHFILNESSEFFANVFTFYDFMTSWIICQKLFVSNWRIFWCRVGAPVDLVSERPQPLRSVWGLNFYIKMYPRGVAFQKMYPIKFLKWEMPTFASLTFSPIGYFINYFFYVGPPKEDIFLDTF